jgi:hypothetical protein
VVNSQVAFRDIALAVASIPSLVLLLLVVRLILSIMMMVGTEIVLASAVVQSHSTAVHALVVDVLVSMTIDMAPAHSFVLDALVADLLIRVSLGKKGVQFDFFSVEFFLSFRVGVLLFLLGISVADLKQEHLLGLLKLALDKTEKAVVVDLVDIHDLEFDLLLFFFGGLVEVHLITFDLVFVKLDCN